MIDSIIIQKSITINIYILNRLSGNTNVVYTGVAIKYHNRTVKFTEKTEVRFAKLTDENIRDYVETGEPL